MGHRGQAGRRWWRPLAVWGLVAVGGAAGAVPPRPPEPSIVRPEDMRVEGDRVPVPVTAEPGDARRGRSLLIAREAANCVLCHAVPDPAIRFAGNVGPSLAGIGGRFDAAQLRLRIADSQRLNPDTIMPSYYRTDALHRVARQYRGQPVLTAQEVEDIVAYLGTLK